MKRGDDMARPSKCRRICREPAFESFAPDGISSRGNIVLTLDEYEAIRLIDLEKNTHEQCAAQMEVSRSTVTEIYEAARYKIADSLVHGKALLISGGHYRFCDGTASAFCHRSCVRTINPQTIQRKEEMQMRIAVTYQDGMIFNISDTRSSSNSMMWKMGRLFAVRSWTPRGRATGHCPDFGAGRRGCPDLWWDRGRSPNRPERG